MQRKLIEYAEHLRRQREAIDYEEMLLVRKSKELTDVDMKRLRYQREAVEKDQRNLERRRKMEENEMQKKACRRCRAYQETERNYREGGEAN